MEIARFVPFAVLGYISSCPAKEMMIAMSQTWISLLYIHSIV
jgi:hypothetical protein